MTTSFQRSKFNAQCSIIGSLVTDNSLPGLRSRSYFGGVGKIDKCPSSAVAVQPLRRMDKLIIASEGGQL